ncbi:MAG TPA: PH domain-containing protein [Chloroflexota bacterium]|nr:PH domain-containing protein [Chloroflexota bacterium]
MPGHAGAIPPPSADPSVEVVEPRIRTNLPGFVEETLHPSESVLGSFSASLFDHHRQEQLRHDKFVLTNERIILYHTSLIHKGLAEMPYKTITGVSYNRGVFHGKVVIEAANTELTLEGIGNDDAAFAEKVIASCVAGRKLIAAAQPEDSNDR